MKSIPTQYHGTVFRSRLEASWAQYFDRIAMPWHYEPEGFTLDDGTNYLPDFWLPTADAWAEVKGPHNKRMDKTELFAAELWRDSGAHDTYDRNAPMILKLTAPNSEDDCILGHPTAPWPLNVLGPGKGGSAAFTQCPNCQKTTAVALWQPWCRNCGQNHPTWHPEDALCLEVPFMFAAHNLLLDGPAFEYIKSDYQVPVL